MFIGIYSYEIVNRIAQYIRTCLCSGFLCSGFFAGNGYCRSEAVVVVFLTKKSMAKRIYATIVNAGSNTDGFKEQGKISVSGDKRFITGEDLIYEKI